MYIYLFIVFIKCDYKLTYIYMYLIVLNKYMFSMFLTLSIYCLIYAMILDNDRNTLG